MIIVISNFASFFVSLFCSLSTLTLWFSLTCAARNSLKLRNSVSTSALVNFFKDHKLHEPLKVKFLRDHKLHEPLLAWEGFFYLLNDELSSIFSWILLLRNQMIFIVQFGINNLVQTFQRPQILLVFEKNLLVLIRSKSNSKSCDYLYQLNTL